MHPACRSVLVGFLLAFSRALTPFENTEKGIAILDVRVDERGRYFLEA
jgi:hypothetical protein